MQINRVFNNTKSMKKEWCINHWFDTVDSVSCSVVGTYNGLQTLTVPIKVVKYIFQFTASCRVWAVKQGFWQGSCVIFTVGAKFFSFLEIPKKKLPHGQNRILRRPSSLTKLVYWKSLSHTRVILICSKKKQTTSAKTPKAILVHSEK